MKFWQVDSFSNEPFKGNPAAVVILETDISDELKQNIAMEMNLSETVFVLMGEGNLEIRWFTPNSEVTLCGHATLAAGHILFTENFINKDSVSFTSNSGEIGVSKGLNDSYTLDFPKQAAVNKPEYQDLVRDILRTDQIDFIGANHHDAVAVVREASFVRNYQADLVKISELPERGFLLTAKSDTDQYDYIYRSFFPKLSVPEDPVTGSANTLLAPYWANTLSKTSLTAFQASSRSGELSLEVESERVFISGQAVTVIEGELLVG